MDSCQMVKTTSLIGPWIAQIGKLVDSWALVMVITYMCIACGFATKCVVILDVKIREEGVGVL